MWSLAQQLDMYAYIASCRRNDVPAPTAEHRSWKPKAAYVATVPTTSRRSPFGSAFFSSELQAELYVHSW
jgi:hypothetical protein